MRLRNQIILILAAVGIILGGALVFRHLSGPRVIARAVTPDGVEMCLVQQFNWSAEPFTTRFVYRKPGAEWGSFYYDHQDDYWNSARVSLDTNARVAVFYRGPKPAVTFAWDSEIYTMHRWNRTMTGAQWRLPANWSPGKSAR